ncbi:hypothetical protein D3C87_2130280 [compost metagenome]
MDLRVAADVGFAIERASVKFLFQRLARLRVAPHQHHTSAGGGQATRDVGAQALRAAGDNGGLAGQAGKA